MTGSVAIEWAEMGNVLPAGHRLPIQESGWRAVLQHLSRQHPIEGVSHIAEALTLAARDPRRQMIDDIDCAVRLTRAQACKPTRVRVDLRVGRLVVVWNDIITAVLTKDFVAHHAVQSQAVDTRAGGGAVIRKSSILRAMWWRGSSTGCRTRAPWWTAGRNPSGTSC